MAAQLIGDMTGPWKSDDYSDMFGDAILALVSKKVEAGETRTVSAMEDAPSEADATNVIDLTELLARSLGKRRPMSRADGAPRSAAPAKKVATKASARRRA